MPRSTDRRRTDSELTFQQLEPRQLLAGDVSVSIVSGQLFVTGDDADNQILITGTRRGSASVIGLEGTTINGSEDPFVASYPGLRKAVVRLGAGHDQATIQGVRFNWGLDVDSGAGDDNVVLRNGSLGSDLTVNGGEGRNVIEVDDMFVVGNSGILTGSGNDFVSILSHVVVDSFFVRTGAGADVLAGDEIVVMDSLFVDMGADNDQALLAGRTNAGRNSIINMGSGNDFLGVLPEQNGRSAYLDRNIRIDAGADDDYVVIGDGAAFNARSTVAGNAGIDTLDYAASSGLGSGNISGFENINTGHYDLILNDLYNYLNSAGIDPGAFGLETPVIIDVDSTPLNHTETDPPTLIDPGLEVTVEGTDTGLIDGAVVEISSGFVSGQDFLRFTPASGIFSFYDPDTGVLSLSGTASIADYESVLRSVAYANGVTGDDFVSGPRVISFRVVSEGIAGTDQRTVNVEAASEDRLITNYLTENNLTAERTASGLYYIITQEGDGNFPNLNSEVTVSYKGTLLEDGSVFDSRSNWPFLLSDLIPGWQEGIPLISRGGSATLIVPSALGYGSTPRPGIPANSILIFDIFLVDFT